MQYILRIFHSQRSDIEFCERWMVERCDDVRDFVEASL